MPAQTSQDKEVDITTLEMAFAKDPASDAFISLSEAYLKQGRFMEAMVVCKKGIKSKPDSREGRLLLARIYAEQGKVPKALDEVTKLIDDGDGPFAPALVLKGSLLDKKGDGDEAIETFKAALDADPENEDAQSALKEKGVDYTPPSAAPPEPPPEQLEVTAPGAPIPGAPMPGAPMPGAPMPGAPVPGAPPTGWTPGTPQTGWTPSAPPMTAAPGVPGATYNPSVPGMAVAPSVPPMGVPSTPPVQRPVGPRPPSTYDGRTFDPNQGMKAVTKKGAGVTLGILATGIAILGIFLIWFAVHASNLRKIDKLNTEASDLIAKDNAASLGKAIEKLDEVLKMDDEQSLAVGLKAFALAVRVHDHGIRDEADKLNEALKAAKDDSDTSWRWAAEIIDMIPGDPEGAEKLALEKTKEGYVTVATYVALADAALASGKIDVAKAALKSARENGPTSVRAQVASGEFYRRMMQINLAKAQYDAAIKTSPNHALALTGRAILSLEERTGSAAVAAYRDWESIRDIGRANIGPRIWGRAKSVDAYLSKLKGKNEEAERSLKEAEEKAREDADTLYMTGKVLYMLEKKSEAIEALRKAVSKDENRLGTLIALAQLYEEEGKSSEAERYLAKARKLDSENIEIVITEALSKRRERKYPEAISLLKKAEAERPSSAKVAIELLDTYRMAKDYASTREQFEKINKNFGTTKSVMTRALVIMGRVFLAQNDLGPANASFKTAIEVDPKNAEAYYFRCYGLKGDRKSRTEAYAACQKYLELASGGEFADQAKKLADQLR